MQKGLRNYAPGNEALSEVLVWTDLVPGTEEPWKYVQDPKTGRRWRRLTPEQEFIAEQIVQGVGYRDACRAAGMKIKPESMSGYVSWHLREHAPFVNHVIELLIEQRASRTVTQESHLSRLDTLGRKAEKEGKYSAAIAAEVARGRAAGLYAKDEAPGKEKVVVDSLKALDDRIKELVDKANKQEKAVQGRVVSDND